MAGLSNRACSVGFASLRNFGQALSRILAFAVVGVGASLRRLCATAIVHPCTFMNALLVSHPCETLGVHFIRHPCLTRTVRVRPPAPKKAGLCLFVVAEMGRGLSKCGRWGRCICASTVICAVASVQ